ncbi:histidine phosphatase family protein [Corynebacterium pseudopelargi]|uniref:Glucosyl-3-phosphoglycerate phosphatase n=1 Tax=Corynebacterium pseudopelargi TaxID=2080757 RepID=A0A3G6IRT1_9CORY|nr:histidine phosphatase family protein [Corynebacterium pseudopelargi]AZA08305.1 Glucosyl-3-phosphoglycerate phosphatase [Corynebacterium pseudopelargi]
MGNIVLLRHGETYGNIARRLDTRPPGAELTPEGRVGAHAAGHTLATLCPKLSLGVSSIAIRAQQSLVAGAEGFAEATGRKLALDVLPGLHEVDAGDFEDATSEQAHHMLANVMRSWISGDAQARIPGGESAQDVLDRMVPVLEGLAGQDGDVLVVCHGGVMRILGAYLAAVPPTLIRDVPVLNSTAIVLDDQWRCRWWVDRWL